MKIQPNKMKWQTETKKIQAKKYSNTRLFRQNCLGLDLNFLSESSG